MRARILRSLSVLPLPLLALGSAHELYLRNQSELEGAVSVLVPFWAGGLAVAAVGFVLTELSARAWARRALWAYHTAGVLFLVYSFLRAQSWQGYAAAWALDQLAAVPIGLVIWGLLVVALSGSDPDSVKTPLALFAITLLLQETWRLGTRLSTPTLPTEAAAPLLDTASASRANVYHLVLDAFQPEVFDEAWAGRPLDGFLQFTNTRSLFNATIPSMTSVFTGCRPPDAQASLSSALSDRASLPRRLASGGYKTVAYLPANVYEGASVAFDSVIWHAADLPRAESQELHRWLFARLWLATLLPTGLLDLFAGRDAFGLAADDMRSLRNQKVSVLTQPVTSLLSFDRYLRHEASLPAQGRYTLIHLLLPHGPFVLRSDCSHGDIRSVTSEVEQSRCAVRLVDRFLGRLEELGRLRDSVVLIHSDHGSWTGTEEGIAKESTALLLIKASGATGPLRRIDAAVSLPDVGPTLQQLAGLDPVGGCGGRALPITGETSY